MQISRLSVIGFAVAAMAMGCESFNKMMGKKESGEGKEVRVTLDQLSPQAKATVQREIKGGQVEKIDAETERGREVYDVEANVDGKHMEYLIAKDTGEVLGTEVPVPYASLPEPVRAAAEKHFGTNEGLTSMKCVEYGETKYEVEGMKSGKKSEISVDAMGKHAD